MPLHDEDSVAGDQADERDQANLTVDIDGREAEERDENIRHLPGQEISRKELHYDREHGRDPEAGEHSDRRAARDVRR